jgi:protein SCO1
VNLSAIVGKTKLQPAFVAGLAFMSIAGCSDPDAQPEQTSAVKFFEVNGIVQAEPDWAGHAVVIEHENIPGFMPSMTMAFAFQDAGELEGVRVGDAIAFTLAVSETDSWIKSLRKINPAGLSLPKAKPAASPSTTQRLKEGEPLPQFELVDQRGRTIRRENFEGKPLLLTFIFTRCPLPNYCPLISQNFREIQQAVAADTVLGGSVNLLSISFDEQDTPSLLEAYSRRFSEDPDTWRFATGSPEEIGKLTRGFAVHVQPEGGTISHGLATALIDGSGAIRQIWRGNGWKPAEVVSALRNL